MLDNGNVSFRDTVNWNKTNHLLMVSGIVNV
jgi:hypothetical protein